ncbi:MAG: quinolinate synthase NadA [Fimbriimonadales bacterium]
MFQAPLPDAYADLTPEEISERIRIAKQKLGSQLVILGHHYQRDEIIQHADYRGDSFKLCKDANRHPEAKFIVFCGVHFMAESADVLTPDSQSVILPNLAAGCSMADMANSFQVKSAWTQIENGIGTGKMLPITYINSAANLKAFVGERDGTVCTSTNAPKAVEWALKNAEKLIFFPDQHLGRNTGIKLGYNHETEMCLWDPFKPLGGNDAESIKRSKFILWKGHCSVHQRFTVEQIREARAKNPETKIIVHPECTMEVVAESDFAGSTEFILKTISEAPPQTSWAVGTEINLVSRIAKEQPEKQVTCLDPMICPCSTMYRIHPSFLCWSLENIVNGEPQNIITVPPKTKEFARIALDRMLSLI